MSLNKMLLIFTLCNKSVRKSISIILHLNRMKPVRFINNRATGFRVELVRF